MTPNEIINKYVHDDLESVIEKIHAIPSPPCDIRTVESLLIAAKAMLFGPLPSFGVPNPDPTFTPASVPLLPVRTSETAVAPIEELYPPVDEFADCNTVCEFCGAPFGSHATDHHYAEVDGYRVVRLCYDDMKVRVAGHPSGISDD